MSRLRNLKRAAALCVVTGCAGIATLYGLPIYYSNRNKLKFHYLNAKDRKEDISLNPLKSRTKNILHMKEIEYDVIVVGGGASGCGVALDSVTRGLKTALIEKFDFATGTSSRSTKLIHGGVRYLQKALMGLDIEQYNMVKEALAERANLIEIAPHLAFPLPIMLPVYTYWQIPYFWAGIKAYDLVAGSQLLEPSYYLPKSKALENFPMLKKDKLKGAIVYYDGQHEDARMCVSIAMTAARAGANIANYTEVVDLLKSTDSNGNEVISGVKVKDRLTGEEFCVRSKCVINATGPFTDFMRNLDQPEERKICQPSSGVHIILPGYYSPSKMGLLDPATSDGRIIFFLPWQNSTIAGTTDSPCDVTDAPEPSEKEIEFILSEVKHYLSDDVNVRRGDVLSAWAGIRPLVLNPAKKDTQSLARNHIIEISKSKMVTIAGGKWTTYRSMAEETVDAAIKTCDLKPSNDCVTKGFLLEGAYTWTPAFFIRLIQDYGVDADVAQHLSNTYGDKSIKVAKLSSLTGKRWPISGKRLHEEYPYIEAEVIYAVRREYACTAIDILARRTRIAFLNVHAALEVLPKVIEIMASEFQWNEEKQKEEYDITKQFLIQEMGLGLKKIQAATSIDIADDYKEFCIKRFQSLDLDDKGFISVNDLRRSFKLRNEVVTESQLSDILSEVDLNKNGEIDQEEFLMLMSALKSGAVTGSRFARAIDMVDESREKISIDRSCGGL